ncbi:sigma-54-dependent Fis family transcriptional regulator [Halomonas heilongjiangensis]|uniref:Sigma-54-dependent Fis family transcriptional regulator n=1 Tax=Halomonas heilongjiangensis TaxID=1387883 RepID=A0A2N7TN43_9GAMM|nr:sigma-54-dependent Fis family transcriptional regulator [Halomonas heilongjiangensis]PMR69548.1 sigma-54-dependent Fis family transcriptional regulator [Halomonas heilongjiangensis]PXX89498.1 sigma-54-dependent Fis family transcriptional regulator [Halomonas heilongjiangensis]
MPTPLTTPRYPDSQDILDKLRFLPAEGQIWLGEQRMLLLQVQTMATFRKEIVNTMGLQRARSFFMRLGYHAGIQDAELARAVRGQDMSVADGFLTGPQLHALRGLVKVVPIALEIDTESGHFYGEFEWQDSYEVIISQNTFGPLKEPVCWLQLGYACAYSSQFLGQEIQYREVECRGCGDARCRIVGKPAQEWEDHTAFAELFREDPLIDELYELQSRIAYLEDDIARHQGEERHRPIGQSPAFLGALDLIDRAARSEVPILLLGETGTGKEILAHRVHQKSERASGPFVAVNCAAIPPELIESELFGVEKGAYTGAVQSRAGRFERAHGGTLFLDELAELSPRAQAALLRVLQEKQIERVGGQASYHVDVRIVAATHGDLAERVQDGRFRADLFYRLNAYPVLIPPLRERRDDIPLLADHFLARCEQHYRLKTLGFTDQAQAAMSRHDWPGNIRELQNTIERGVILTGDRHAIGEQALFGQHPLPARGQVLGAGGRLTTAAEDAGGESSTATLASLCQSILDDGISLDALEEALLEQAYREAGSNVSAAARRLGLSRAALDYRLRKRRML